MTHINDLFNFLSELKKKKMKKIKKAIMIAFMTKVVALMMAVLGGAVLLAKKALIVATVSLLASSVTAANKKATSAAYTGDYDNARLGTASYIDLISGIPKSYDKHIEPLSHTRAWPTSQVYHEQYHPNFVHNHERFYAQDAIQNIAVQPQFQVFSNNNDAESDWLGLTHPEDIQ
jgi:hypothetical protein